MRNRSKMYSLLIDSEESEKGKITHSGKKNNEHDEVKDLISNENESALKFISGYCNCYKCGSHPTECKECSFDARQMIYSYKAGFEAGLKYKS